MDLSDLVNTDEIMEAARHAERVLDLKNKPHSLFSVGSRVQGYHQPDSDFDFIFVIEGLKDNMKALMRSDSGHAVEAGLVTTDTFCHDLSDRDINRFLKDKFLFTVPHTIRDDLGIEPVIEKNVINIAEQFLGFLNFLAGRLGKQKDIMFDLESAVNWPAYMRVFNTPEFGYRIARRISSSIYPELHQIQIGRYREAFSSIPEVEFISDSQIIFYSDGYTFYNPVNLNMRKNYFQRWKHTFRRASDIITRKEVYSGSPLKEIAFRAATKLRKEGYNIIGYVHNARILSEGCMRIDNNNGRLTYFQFPLERITTKSLAFSIMKSFYQKMLDCDHRRLQKTAREQKLVHARVL